MIGFILTQLMKGLMTMVGIVILLISLGAVLGRYVWNS